MSAPTVLKTRLRPEYELLFCIARRDLSRGQESELRHLLLQSLDWSDIIETADNHGLLSLLHHHLSDCLGLVPQAVRQELSQKVLSNSQQVLILVADLLRLQSCFHENRITYASFKGPLLSQLAYGDLALRPAGDLDILIAKDDFERAAEALKSLGYKPTTTLSPAQLRSHLDFHCELSFQNKRSNTVVDLHWELAPETFVLNLFAIDFLSRLKSEKLAGVQVDTFSREDLILYLATHGAKHLWRRLEWISALAEVIQGDSFNWDLLFGRARDTRTTRMLSLGLWLANVCFEVTVPMTTLTSIEGNQSMRRMAETIRENIFVWPVSEPESTETAMYNLKVMDRKADAVVSMMRAIWTPTLSDFEAVALPGSLHALYYAVRPFRLSKTYGSQLWRKLVRKSA